jgi:ribonuclease P protein component
VPTLSHRYRLDVRLKLARAADFDRVFKQGQRSADQLFTILYHRSGLDHPRLGMTASAKRVRTAVRRNRIRRLIRESFRHAACRLAGLDIVVIVKEPANRAPNADVFRSLDGHWARLEQANSRA